MGLFSKLGGGGGEYQNVDAAITATAITGDDDSPPLVVATAVAAAAADSTLLPSVAEAINLSKFASSTPPTTQQQQAGGLPVTATLGRFPAALSTCPICHRSQITTRIRTYPSCETWTMVTTLFLVFWPICWIPLVVDSCKMTDHFCTICSENVGTVKPMSDCCVKEMS